MISNLVDGFLIGAQNSVSCIVSRVNRRRCCICQSDLGGKLVYNSALVCVRRDAKVSRGLLIGRWAKKKGFGRVDGRKNRDREGPPTR